MKTGYVSTKVIVLVVSVGSIVGHTPRNNHPMYFKLSEMWTNHRSVTNDANKCRT